MSGAIAALQSIGIKPDNYYACEIDKYSEAVSRFHYPDIIRLGDVRRVSFFGLPKIDLLVAGFPCQSFSLAGKQLNFNDPRGQLFFEVVRLIDELQPKYFLLENVASMRKEIRQIINEMIGYKAIEINSALVSAQNRNRLYWTNIPGITQPEDRGIVLRDILENGAESVLRWQNKIAGSVVSKTKAATLRASGGTDIRKMQKVIYNTHPSGKGMNGRVFDVDGKCGTLTTNKGEGAKVGIQQRARGYNKGGLFFDKSPTLSSNSWQDNNHLTDGLSIRKLTPIECERLQTFPDDYTKYGIDNKGNQIIISNSQRYKMLGNGFTRDIISHIVSHIPTINRFKNMSQDLLGVAIWR